MKFLSVLSRKKIAETTEKNEDNSIAIGYQLPLLIDENLTKESPQAKHLSNIL